MDNWMFLVLGIFIGTTGTLSVKLWISLVQDICRFIGRRRTEARLRGVEAPGIDPRTQAALGALGYHERADGSWRRQSNGATSSERSAKPSAPDGNTHGR